MTKNNNDNDNDDVDIDDVDEATIHADEIPNCTTQSYFFTTTFPRPNARLPLQSNPIMINQLSDLVNQSIDQPTKQPNHCTTMLSLLVAISKKQSYGNQSTN